MIVSYQKDVYDLLPNVFTRKQILSIATDLNINSASAVTYIHSWTKRNLIKRISEGTYEKCSEEFIPGVTGWAAVKKYKEIKQNNPDKFEDEVAVITNKTDTGMKSKDMDYDTVLDAFNVKSATDEELLKELVERGFQWDNLRKVIITEFKFSDYKVA